MSHPRCNTNPPLLKRLSRKRGPREVAQVTARKVHVLTHCRTGSWKNSNVEVFPVASTRRARRYWALTSHLLSASSKSTDMTDQASFPLTDTVITTKKTVVLTAAGRNINRQRVPVLWIFCTTNRRSKSCELVVRHFLVGAAG